MMILSVWFDFEFWFKELMEINVIKQDLKADHIFSIFSSISF